MSGKPLPSFQYELIIEEGGCRTIVRSWPEIDGYVQIAYQEYEYNSWKDIAVLPAMNRENLVKFIRRLDSSSTFYFNGE